jgi:hypothetical protein
LFKKFYWNDLSFIKSCYIDNKDNIFDLPITIVNNYISKNNLSKEDVLITSNCCWVWFGERGFISCPFDKKNENFLFNNTNKFVFLVLSRDFGLTIDKNFLIKFNEEMVQKNYSKNLVLNKTTKCERELLIYLYKKE